MVTPRGSTRAQERQNGSTICVKRRRRSAHGIECSFSLPSGLDRIAARVASCGPGGLYLGSMRRHAPTIPGICC